MAGGEVQAMEHLPSKCPKFQNKNGRGAGRERIKNI
jgi:hypothetical protein